MHPVTSWKGRFLAAAVSVAASLAAFASTASADLIYDNRPNATAGGTLTTTTSQPRNYMADSMSTLTTTLPWQTWEVQTIGWQLWADPGTYNSVTARVRVYDTFDSAVTGQNGVFSGLVSDVTWNLGTVTNSGTGPLAFTSNLNYAGNALNFDLGDGQGIGVSIELLVGGAAPTGLASVVRGGGFDPIIGTSANGWYRDADADGVIEASDLRTFGAPNNPSHLALQIDAIAIPEPAFAGLGAAALLLLARRRRA